MNKATINQNIVLYAFRYCLGRKTYAVDECIGYLKENWEELDEETQTQIRCEIRVAIKDKRAGMDCDVKNWKQLLKGLQRPF